MGEEEKQEKGDIEIHENTAQFINTARMLSLCFITVQAFWLCKCLIERQNKGGREQEGERKKYMEVSKRVRVSQVDNVSVGLPTGYRKNYFQKERK